VSKEQTCRVTHFEQEQAVLFLKTNNIAISHESYNLTKVKKQLVSWSANDDTPAQKLCQHFLESLFTSAERQMTMRKASPVATLTEATTTEALTLPTRMKTLTHKIKEGTRITLNSAVTVPSKDLQKRKAKTSGRPTGKSPLYPGLVLRGMLQMSN
jgi:hypothetical protein